MKLNKPTVWSYWKYGEYYWSR